MEWHPIAVPTDHQLLSIDFPSSHVGYIGGHGVLLKSTDGGLNWSELTGPTAPFPLGEGSFITDLHFFTENHGLMVVGYWTGLFETTDGGANWSQVIPATLGFCRFKCLLFEDSQNGLLGGGGCFQSGLIDKLSNGIWATTETVETWNSSELISGMARKDDIVISVTDFGRIMRSIDGAGTWAEITQEAVPGAILTDVALMADDVFRVSYELDGSFGILHSLDLGLTWEIDWDLATFFYPDMFTLHMNGAGVEFIGGREGNMDEMGVIFSKSPAFWNLDVVDQTIRDIDSSSDSVTWAVGDSGAVYVNVDPLLLEVEEQGSLSGFKVYPNPSSAYLNIEGTAGPAVNLVSVSNAEGRLIEVTNSSVSDRLQLDIGDLIPGKYIVTIRVQGELKQFPFIKN